LRRDLDLALRRGFGVGGRGQFVVVQGQRRNRAACGDNIGHERVEELLRVIVCGIGVCGVGVCGIEVCGIERREGGGIGVRRSECVVYTDFRSRNRIWSVRDGKRLGCRDLRGALLTFVVSLRGLDEFGVGADFEEQRCKVALEEIIQPASFVYGKGLKSRLVKNENGSAHTQYDIGGRTTHRHGHGTA